MDNFDGPSQATKVPQEIPAGMLSLQQAEILQKFYYVVEANPGILGPDPGGAQPSSKCYASLAIIAALGGRLTDSKVCWPMHGRGLVMIVCHQQPCSEAAQCDCVHHASRTDTGAQE